MIATTIFPELHLNFSGLQYISTRCFPRLCSATPAPPPRNTMAMAIAHMHSNAPLMCYGVHGGHGGGGNQIWGCCCQSCFSQKKKRSSAVCLRHPAKRASCATASQYRWRLICRPPAGGRHLILPDVCTTSSPTSSMSGTASGNMYGWLPAGPGIKKRPAWGEWGLKWG